MSLTLLALPLIFLQKTKQWSKAVVGNHRAAASGPVPVHKESATGPYSFLAFQTKALKHFLKLDAKCYCFRSFVKALIARNIRLLASCDEIMKIHRHLLEIISEFATVL